MRARNIKPGFFMNTKLSDADFATRLLFIGLWCYADKAGRFEWDEKRIKASIFPYDNVNVKKMMTTLLNFGFVNMQNGIGYIVNFEKHQHPHHTERPSKLPAFSNGCDLTVKQQLSTGDNPSDSLIHGFTDSLIHGFTDSLIPDSNTEVSVVSAKASRPAKIRMSDDEWLREIKINPAYAGVDVEREMAKMQAWCMTKGKTPSRARLINWLNNAEKPLRHSGACSPAAAGAFERAAELRRKREELEGTFL